MFTVNIEYPLRATLFGKIAFQHYIFTETTLNIDLLNTQ